MKRRLFWIACSIAFLVLVGWGVVSLFQARAKNRLRAILDAMDATDPGWRYEDLVKSLPDIPPHENSASRIAAAAAGLASDWGSDTESTALRRRPPNLALDAKERALLDKLLAEAGNHIVSARELAKYPRGRFPDPEGNIRTYAAAKVLSLDALDCAQRGDTTQALRSARAALAASDAYFDAGGLLSESIRAAFLFEAFKSVERTLALGTASEADLVELEKLLEPHRLKTRASLALRFERAGMHLHVEALMQGGTPHSFLGSGSPARSWRGWASDQFYRAFRSGEYPEALALMNRLVEAAELPSHEQIDAEKEVEADAKRLAPDTVGVLFPLNHPGKVGRQILCKARALKALLAVERYRLKHGTFPDKLEDAAGAVLDPIDAKPMGYVPFAEGIIIYSIGEDQKDDGGAVAPPEKDFGFRLWHPAHRKKTGGKP